MAKTKYHIELSEEEHALLTKIVSEGREPERTVMRAKILLLSDSRNEKLTVPKLAELLGTTHTTVQTVRTEYGKYGLEMAVFRKKRTVDAVRRRINIKVREEIFNMTLEAPPMGCKRWSVRTIAREAVNRGIVNHISPATVAAILKSRKPDEA